MYLQKTRGRQDKAKRKFVAWYMMLDLLLKALVITGRLYHSDFAVVKVNINKILGLDFNCFCLMQIVQTRSLYHGVTAITCLNHHWNTSI